LNDGRLAGTTVLQLKEAALMTSTFARATLALLMATLVAPGAPGAEYRIEPGDDPQAILDAASPGDRLIFQPGLHERPLGRHQSMLYVDKSVHIELMEGATLRLADNQTQLLSDPEITTDHSYKTIDDLQMGGDYDLSRGPMILTIRIDGAGSGGSPDTFSWGYGVRGTPQQSGIEISGGWQSIGHGIDVYFENTTGHNKGADWFISYDGPESYGIRVGHGTQQDYIEDVSITGLGTIDLNSQNNVQPSGFVKNISATVLAHGRVRNVHVEGITMTNTMRSVMAYGEHTGEFLQGGDVGPGESFDAEGLTILSTHTDNPDGGEARGYLLGHPSHRGKLTDVVCNFNTMVTNATALEPNFQLDQYEVIGNLIQSNGQAVHCWRKSTNGLVEDNVRLGNTSGKAVVVNNAPSGWERSENLTIRGNTNLQSGPYPNTFGDNADQTAGHFGLDTTTGDDGFHALTPSIADVLALGEGEAAEYRLVVLGRNGGGNQYGAFSAYGKAWHGPEGIELSDDWVRTASRSGSGIELRVVPGDGDQLSVEVRGLPGETMTWVGHMEMTAIEPIPEPAAVSLTVTALVGLLAAMGRPSCRSR
jgi:hypothetical protein